MSYKQGLSSVTKANGLDNMAHWCGKVRCRELAIFTITHVSRLRVTLNSTDQGFSVIPAESGIPSMGLRSARPSWLLTEYYLFGRAGLTAPTRLESLFRPTLYTTVRHNGIHGFKNLTRGRWNRSDGLARCQMHRVFQYYY